MREKDFWETPQYITDALGPFDLDPCAGNREIAKANWRDNGLDMTWSGFVWCNPPYSNKEAWISKMVAHGNGIIILPERGSAPWFGPLALYAGCYFVMGKKINFIGGPSSNNLGSVLFPFGLTAKDRLKSCGLPGHMVEVIFFNKRLKTQT